MLISSPLPLCLLLLLHGTTPCLGQVDLLNSHGLVCALGIDDPMPTACPRTGFIKQAGSGGKIECGENFGCCLCQSIICGKPDGSQTCDELNCNGDSGCYGVRDIQIYGSKGGGAVISCNGDESCNSTKITGTNIGEVTCTGDGACARSVFEFSCLPNEPCSIECAGEAACAGQPPPADGSTDYLTTHFSITNTAGILCSDEGCKYGTFELTQNSGGEGIGCEGVDACLEASITINNIEGIICGGTNACKNANILVIDPMQDFEVECSAAGSCEGMKLELVINNNVDYLKGFGCYGEGSCVDASITIINNGNQYITVENLECESPGACKRATFDFDGGEGGIGFENCMCGEEESCDGITGIDSCLSGLEKLTCKGQRSCAGLEQQVANVANGFEVICNNIGACQGFWLMILLNNNGRDDTTEIKGYKCGKDQSCKDAVIQLNNEQNRHNVVAYIAKIECNGVSACENTKFILVGNVIINDLVCSSSSSCINCNVVDAQTNTITPCGSFIGDSDR
eukprot:CAMPEP_0197035016 /NCGR_PEP_ID=MMETSP1384-20130603/12919_1 /TAXON_ID=29189 /ORGANISM="Ammonia sp." /LENGTH=513 /DNA_ID=CAMNT_0042465007 /DNA_START=18 /DNA_END=1559 /DNA_ORIENTATION=+